MSRLVINSTDWVYRSLYPFEHKYITLDRGTMHYIDKGEGEVLLFVHGTPTWSFLYRDLIKNLSDTYRCIAIDHLGFGLSSSDSIDPFTPEWHAENLIEFVQRLNLKRITLCVHDFGGPIGLASAIRMPDRFKQVVMFNTWLWETKGNPEAQKINKLVNSWLGKQLYLRFNVSPRLLLKKGFRDKKYLTREIHAHYLKPFPNKRSRMSLLELAKSLVGSSDWYAAQWAQLEKLSDKKWLILWGTKDEFITTQYLERWRAALPAAQVVTLDCGHFVPEEATQHTLESIQTFLEDHKELS